MLRLRIKPGNLIERNAQRHFRQVTVLDVNRRAEDADTARFQFRQIIRRQHAGTIAFFVQIHEHIEVKIDNPVRMKSLDALIDGFFFCGHCFSADRSRKSHRHFTQIAL